ncbi:MAG: T9SS type A sorting domain-containing protein [Ignavibacteriales bacterium]|nr:T9SS type A sorting domain-containing protein [Ignavibacteriales bacterium]
MLGNYPNPFNPETVIRYNMPVSGTVSLKIYDSRGELISTLSPDITESGTHEIHLNMSGKASGVYFYTLENVSGENTISRLTGKFVMTK